MIVSPDRTFTAPHGMPDPGPQAAPAPVFAAPYEMPDPGPGLEKAR
ncbi:hypothetical protein ACFY19_03760 [Streptosporangium saharense]